METITWIVKAPGGQCKYHALLLSLTAFMIVNLVYELTTQI